MYITVLHTVPMVFLLLFCFLKGKIITYFYELFMIIIFLLFLFSVCLERGNQYYFYELFISKVSVQGILALLAC